jgi:hypothetical protein
VPMPDVVVGLLEVVVGLLEVVVGLLEVVELVGLVGVGLEVIKLELELRGEERVVAVLTDGVLDVKDVVVCLQCLC